MTFHFLGNHLVDGGELVFFIIALMAAVVVILILLLGKKTDGASISLIVVIICLYIGMLLSGTHYDVQHVKNEMRAQGYGVLRFDHYENRGVFGNGGCELIYEVGVIDGRHVPYVVVDGVKLGIRAEDIAAICNVMKG